MLRNVREAFAAAHSALNGQAAPLEVYDGRPGNSAQQKSSLTPVYWPKDPYTGAALCSLGTGDTGNDVTLKATNTDVSKAMRAMGKDLKHFICGTDNRPSEPVTRLMAAAPIIAGLPDTHPDILRTEVRPH